jgi:hypothetical protein
MQGWFAGPSSKAQGKEAGSLLADWNSYAASKEADDGSLSSVASAAAMDLEAGLSSAGTTLAGAFSSYGSLVPVLAFAIPACVCSL